ncbi:hypothetical protein CEXT_717621 [Caerostris extrusa]|uniref:Uncharacterized protein n=1 Tax=Caerostris extrusa TaxID=172846 RepID=A0AAV4NM13_CAEEX|nr:hypothetical protein CEXT_717621 [Caerostris extrusa]
MRRAPHSANRCAEFGEFDEISGILNQQLGGASQKQFFLQHTFEASRPPPPLNPLDFVLRRRTWGGGNGKGVGSADEGLLCVWFVPKVVMEGNKTWCFLPLLRFVPDTLFRLINR